VETGAGAHGVVIDREGRYAYVTNSFADSVSKVDIKEGKVVKTVPVSKNPNGINMTP
jgi:YVTN family beta-propeller protein